MDPRGQGSAPLLLADHHNYRKRENHWARICMRMHVIIPLTIPTSLVNAFMNYLSLAGLKETLKLLKTY